MYVVQFSLRTRHEALQKLAIFFQHNKDGFDDIPEDEGAASTKYSTLQSITSTLTIHEKRVFTN